ncbi:hypothetical protein Rhe02_52980 [Rhizocola hellebori]|uniref:BON domain-containing protein n=1 Tax=Rhizocola hellebori TaxID=1392758 RepID=A0A8J3QAZ4_9ACTN|nr:hypothetical protein [Rhizocola hellebori]GIH07231.1 hypothetical protein Rhe02_52980 [Rhizocola hellebori]
MKHAEHDEYAEASAQRELAEDGGIAEQGMEIVRRDGCVVIRGEVESEHRRDLIAQRVAAHFPHCEVRNDIVVVRVGRPMEAEELA